VLTPGIYRGVIDGHLSGWAVIPDEAATEKEWGFGLGVGCNSIHAEVSGISIEMGYTTLMLCGGSIGNDERLLTEAFQSGTSRIVSNKSFRIGDIYFGFWRPL